MSEKICIVDDNLVNRKLLAGILKKEGYELLEAEAPISPSYFFLPRPR